MSLHFATREIGSLAKPSWRVKAFAGRPIEESDITEQSAGGRGSRWPATRSSCKSWKPAPPA